MCIYEPRISKEYAVIDNGLEPTNLSHMEHWNILDYMCLIDAPHCVTLEGLCIHKGLFAGAEILVFLGSDKMIFMGLFLLELMLQAVCVVVLCPSMCNSLFVGVQWVVLFQ